MLFDQLQFTVILIIINLFLFQDPLQTNVGVFQYYDEIIAYGFFCFLILFFLIIRRVHVLSLFMFVGIIMVLIIGFVGWSANDYQLFDFAFQDSLLIIKALLVYIISRNVLARYDISRYGHIISWNMKIIIIILFLLTIFNLAVPVFPTFDERFGIRSQQLFFSHPVYLSNTAMVVMCLLVTYGQKEVTKFAILAGIVVFFTLRFKVLVTLVFFFFIYILFKRNIKLTIDKLIIVGALGLAISYNQIVYYFDVDEDEYGEGARQVLSEVGPEIAQDHFPLGSGFGSFGSFPSGANYSSLYFIYGVDEVWGLSPDFHDFISDSFWPMIIGELGYFGTFFYGLCLACIILDVLLIRDYEKFYFMGALVLVVHIGIATTSDASLANAYSLPYMMCVAMIVNNSHTREEKRQAAREMEMSEGVAADVEDGMDVMDEMAERESGEVLNQVLDQTMKGVTDQGIIVTDEGVIFNGGVECGVIEGFLKDN